MDQPALLDFYAGENLPQVLFVTGVLGGLAAWLAGRAIALTWRPFWHVVVYMALLGAAVRFIHFALFEGHLVSPASYGIDAIYLLVVAALGWRATRASQMARQYHWLFEKAGPFSWRPRVADAPNGADDATKSG